MFAQQEGMELVVCDTVQQAKGCDVTVLVLGGSSSRFGEVEFCLLYTSSSMQQAGRPSVQRHRLR